MNSKKNIVITLATSGFLLASCNGGSNANSSNGGGSQPVTAAAITIDAAGTVPIIDGAATKSIIYVHNNSKETINGITFNSVSNSSVKLNKSAMKILRANGLSASNDFTIDASQCTSIPAGQSCPIGFTTPAVDAKTAQGSAVIKASFMGSDKKTYTSARLINFAYVDGSESKGAVINSGVSLAGLKANPAAYGTLYIYGSGNNRIYNLNKLAIDNAAFKISQGNIERRQLQSGFVQAIEISTATTSLNTTKSGKSLLAGISGNISAQSTDSEAGQNFSSSASVGLVPVADGAILTSGSIPLIDTSVATPSGSFMLVNSGNEVGTVGTIGYPSDVSVTTDNCSGKTLDLGDTCTVSFDITRQSSGNDDVTIPYTSVSGGAQSVTQSITWYNGTGAPLLAISTHDDPLSFLATHGKNNEITVTNIGGYNLTNVTTATPTATGSATASITTPALACEDATGADTATNLLIGGHCTFTVNVNDTATETGSVKVGFSGSYNDGTAKTYSRNATFGYSSNDNAPILTFNPDPLTTTILGNNLATDTEVITITNTGTTDATNFSTTLINAPSYLTTQSTDCTTTLAKDASCTVTIKLGPVSADSSTSGSSDLKATYSGGQASGLSAQGQIDWSVTGNTQSISLDSINATGDDNSGDGLVSNPYIFNGNNTSGKLVTLTYKNTGTNPILITGVQNTNSPITWQIDSANSSCYSGGALPSDTIAPNGICTLVYKNVLAQNVNASLSIGSSFQEDILLPMITFRDVQSPSQQYQTKSTVPGGDTKIYVTGHQATLANNLTFINGKMNIFHSLANAKDYAAVEVTSRMESYTISSTPDAGCNASAIDGIMTQTCSLTPDANGSATRNVEYVMDYTNYAENPINVLFKASAANQIVNMTSLYATDTLPSNSIVFVSQYMGTGNLGGYAGANDKCNTDQNKPQAGEPGAGKTYKAMLYNVTNTVSGRSYYRLDGKTLVAVATNDPTGFTSPLSASISSVDMSVLFGDITNSCTNWNSNTGNVGRGSSSSMQSAWYTGGLGGCNTNNGHLYCVAQ